MWESYTIKTFNDSFDQDGVLGMKLLYPPELYERIRRESTGRACGKQTRSFPALSNLNGYIEAQILGRFNVRTRCRSYCY